MKRYDVYHEDGSGHESYGNVSYESVDGDWVPASVAQALYDALESLAPEVSIDLWRAAGADKALSLADGDE